ncbi:hypothetical protein Ppa06_44840 [Planomonospora parontospora subsp. parontospora]|uniref:Integral membrane protein n=2 Tax=Planomonospora parontospora TaxID=58119 RepID=A0AA37BL64_9ACTN|nr:hypothetical protein [Planomonospora parontospora]GGK85328.1 hypothetical protein GCM10010126_50700 [Planomonospora parontospora]GII10686.1 hypothetical protein Ppa06_44840 [Planomonospora parontospora subsp. parontospora]
MDRSSSSGDELRAAVEARRELGPEFEDSLVEGFLEKMDSEIDRRVDERLAARAPAIRPSVAAGQRLALSIVSLTLGVPSTVALALILDNPGFVLAVIWVGIIAVNFAFAGGGQHDRRR